MTVSQNLLIDAISGLVFHNPFKCVKNKNYIMKRLSFLHKRNKSKVEGLVDKDIIYLDDFGVEVKEKNNVKFYLNKILDKAKQDTRNYRLDKIQKWAFTKNIENKSFAEHLIFQGKSLWYPVEYFLHCDTPLLDYNPPIARILLYIDCVKDIIKEKKPKQIIIENNKTCFNRIVIKVCKDEKIKITNLNLKEQKRSLSSKITNNSLIIRNYIKGRILLRRIIGKVLCKKTKSKDILILTSDRLSNKENITDYYWGSIVKELNKKRMNYKMVEYDRIDSLNSLKQVRKRYFPQKYDAQFIGTYYDRNTIRNAKKMISFLREKFEVLDKRKDFRESFNYKGIKFYDLIRPRIKKIFLTYSHYLANVYAINKSVIEKEKPCTILIDHEKNYYGRALITEANLKKIFSFAFEGELVYENNPYLTQVPIKGILNKQSPLWRPIPDKKFLWGEYTKEWYQKRNYFPTSNLKVIGAPKYDSLSTLNEEDKQKIRRKYGIKKDEKLVIIITADSPLENKYLSSIFKSLSAAKKLGVVVKMHPNDPALNKKMIEAMIKKFHIKGVAVSNENISKLIHASDIVITYASTLVYECILLNKKTVLVSLFGNLDTAQPYVKEGLIKLCMNSYESNNEIRNCLFKNKQMNNNLRRRFIKEYLYPDDGRASERAVNEIIRIS